MFIKGILKMHAKNNAIYSLVQLNTQLNMQALLNC